MPRPIREVPWLEQRNGVYNVRWYEPPTEEAKRRNPKAKGATKRLGLYTRDAKEATARYAAFLATGYARAVSSSGHLTVVGALERYTDEHVAKKVVDKRRSQIAVDNLTEFFGGDTLLTDIGVPECRSYADSRREAGISDSTIRRELKVLQAAAGHAKRWKRIAINRMPEFEFPIADDEGKDVRWFTREELGLLLGCAAETAELGSEVVGERARRIRDFIILTYGWGARRNSVETLRVEQVRLDKNEVNLQKRGGQITKKRRPVVPIFPEQREVLERLVANNEQGLLFGPSYNSYHVFRKLCERCGFPEDRRHPHMLRHSRATHLLMEGKTPYYVGGILGDLPSTVEKVYAHHCPRFLAS